VAEPAFAFGELIKLVFALGVTIGLFYALALFMKRMQVGTGKSGTLITVLAALPLGGKEKIWVVDVAGEKLVIGTTPGNVNCLHVLRSDASRESNVTLDIEKTLDPGFRRGDAVETLDPGFRRGDAASVQRTPAHAFADVLNKFRNWQKP
jgi:flagellar biosynthetic protein FliO